MADLEEKDEILLLDDESTSTAANKEILACLTSLNAGMLAVNTSLQQFRSDLHMAQRAMQKRLISSDKAELSEQEDDQQSDADKLLNQHGSKRRKIADDSTPEEIESVVNNDSHNNGEDVHTGSQVQEEDLLLAEIAQAMDEREKTAPNISDQLAKIITRVFARNLMLIYDLLTEIV